MPVFEVVGKVTAPSINVAPMFPSTTATRHVPEKSAASTDVGFPVTATDPDGNPLDYALEGSDKGFFSINSDGQITVKEDFKLDHETKPTLSVTVKADDNRGGTDTITVTILVIDVDEAPTITGPGGGVSYTEGDTAAVTTLRATDPENAPAIYWSLLPADTTTGDIPPGVEAVDDDDYAAFDISQNGVLTFKSPPDFEGSSASRDDDIYRVVVQASDGYLSGYLPVIVNVQDKREEGKVTLRIGTTNATLLQPQVGEPITARVTDGDGTPGDATYQWYRSNSRSNTGGTMITTDLTYPPVAADIGKHLYVVATYTSAGQSGQVAKSDPSYYPAIDTTDSDSNTGW